MGPPLTQDSSKLTQSTALLLAVITFCILHTQKKNRRISLFCAVVESHDTPNTCFDGKASRTREKRWLKNKSVTISVGNIDTTRKPGFVTPQVDVLRSWQSILSKFQLRCPL